MRGRDAAPFPLKGQAYTARLGGDTVKLNDGIDFALCLLATCMILHEVVANRHREVIAMKRLIVMLGISLLVVGVSVT